MSDEDGEEQLHPYPQPGEVLEGKYQVEEVLGTGAMGAVVRAIHVLRRAPVALKFMSPHIMARRGVVDRFLNEGIAASKIDNDHVVKVLDVSTLENGVPYMVMEFLEGIDLRQLLVREGSPGLSDIPRCVHFVLQILRGLQAAHAVGVVHRDMKPANCFILEKDGDPDFIKIVDFGISKVEHPDGVELTNPESALGTPLYMSPEQARNPKNVDARSDLYAVSAILYELVAGRPPFVPESGTLSELLIRLGTEAPASLEMTRHDLPSGFWSAVARGLVKDPTGRYQSAADMADGMAAFADARSEDVLRKIRQAARLSREKSGFSAPASTLVIDAAASGERSRVADTAEGMVQDAETRGGRRSFVWFGAAAGAVALSLLGGWLLKRSMSEPVPAATPSASETAAPPVAVTSAPATTSASAPSASSVADVPSASAAPRTTAARPTSSAGKTPPTGSGKPRLGTITIQE
jgi:serine/threonine-protein kinase